MTDPVPPSPASGPGVADGATTDAAVTEPDARVRRRSGGRDGAQARGSFWRELPFLVVVALVLALLIKAFVVQAFFIPSDSMAQTLHVRDRVLVNKVVYRFRDPHRGEVVVFNGKGTGFENAEPPVTPPSNQAARVLRDVQGWLGLGGPGERDVIKRVIAVGGDTVACCDSFGRMTVNGVPLDEPYIYEPSPLVSGPQGRLIAPTVVPRGALWVMGDHRGDSSDSRANGFVPVDKVVGRAFVRVWPVTRLGLLRVPSTFHHVHGPAAASGPLAVGFALALPLAGLRRRARHRSGRRPRPLAGEGRGGEQPASAPGP